MVFSRGPHDRDVFPLPFLHEGASHAKLAASLATSSLKQKDPNNVGWANDGIHSLNELMGAGRRDPAGFLPACCSEAVGHLYSAYSALGSAPQDLPSPAGCYSELLAGSSCYRGERADIAPYAKDLVSWPDIGGGLLDLASSLPQADGNRLTDWKRTLLRDASEAKALQKECGVERPYNDPKLFESPRSYSSFLTRLHACGMVRFIKAEGKTANLGAFFVKKKNGKIRLIFDTRKLNTCFHSPISVQLPTATAMGSVEVQDGCDCHLAHADLSNAFYTMEIPTDLGDLFSLEPIKAGFLPSEVTAGFEWDEEPLPVLCTLPMGWNWSLFFANNSSRVVSRKK